QPRGECLFHRGAAFALQKPAGEFPRRRRALSIIAGQRKEIAATRARRPTGHSRNNNRIAISHQTTARRLLGEISCLNRKNPVADLLFNSYFQWFVPVCECLCVSVSCSFVIRCLLRTHHLLRRRSIQGTRHLATRHAALAAYFRISSRLMISRYRCGSTVFR